MIPITLSTLTQILAGRLVGEHSGNTTVHALSTDSRQIAADCMFVALKGERFDGHDFAATAVNNGAVALLVERELPFDIAQIIVPSAQHAMGMIGAYVRAQVNPVCAALTGSNGKTSVKEMLATILSEQQQSGTSQVLYTAGNFNNEIGVPLTLLRLTSDHQYGVFELGANHKGEIDYTSSLVKPDVALVNNIGSAHLEGFGSVEGIAHAKAEIFNHLSPNGTAVINSDDKFADFMRAAAKNYRQLSFGVEHAADVMAKTLSFDDAGLYSFTIEYQHQAREVSLPLAGRHQVSNALAATTMALSLGLSLEACCLGLEKLQPVKGRMVPKSLGRVLLIDDSYNANPSSVSAAIDWLTKIAGNRCLVLGDLGELGDNAPLLHTELGALAKSQGLNTLFSLGHLSANASQAFGGEHFTALEELVKRLITYINQVPGKVTILVKGSRSAAMERVVEALITAYGRGEFL